MILSLIGMSGVGKSHWAKKAKTLGFRRYDLDALIAKRLEEKLPQDLNLSPTKRMAVWMGFPGDENYIARRDEYLSLEDEITNGVLDEVSMINPRENVLIDTTGSVIHLPYETRQRVLDISAEVIYLESTDVNRKHVQDNFTLDPKPIVWPDGIYEFRNGRTQQESLIASFPRLLEYRTSLYERIATVTIHPEGLIGSDTIQEFMVEVWNGRMEREIINGRSVELQHNPVFKGKER
jgi:hypothetical protein